ncbi:flagellar biosynthesis anti-sigma factor FlgM [bacterium]|nr:flagellar biosynthesis anti-sigma factor FlgM [bacterium]
MILPINSADSALGVHLNKIYKTQSTEAAAKAGACDVVTISQFSSLVEQARSAAMSGPDIRADIVEQAKAALTEGNLADSEDIASSLINRAVEGQV